MTSAPRPAPPVERLDRADAELVRAAGPLPRRRPPEWVVAASLAARGSVLWLVVAAALGTRPGPCRRAAGRGVLAIAITTVSSHLLGGAVRRPRPAAQGVPAREALPEHPSSSSFPSTHAASAAAFATAVTLHAPSVGLVVVPVAGVVAYSRVRTRVHWPTDVVAGVLLGVGVAVLIRHRN